MTENHKRKKTVKFSGILAIISIIGFVNIISESLFQYSILKYFDSAWLFLVGIGFFFAARPKNLYEGSKRYFTETSFARLVSMTIGILSIVSAILSIPQINFEHHVLDTTKSIISFIAIIFILFQSWVLEC